MSVQLELLKAPSLAQEIATDIEAWLKQTERLYERWLRQGVWPFHDNEQAAVSVFLGGAIAAGFLAMAEVDVDKGGRTGRADLRILTDNADYWFEFKRSAWEPSARRWGLEHALRVADDDIAKLDFVAGEQGFAVVIASTDDLTDQRKMQYTKFCDQVDFAYRIGPDDASGAFVYFKKVRKKGF